MMVTCHVKCVVLISQIDHSMSDVSMAYQSRDQIMDLKFFLQVCDDPADGNRTLSLQFYTHPCLGAYNLRKFPTNPKTTKDHRDLG